MIYPPPSAGETEAMTSSEVVRMNRMRSTRKAESPVPSPLSSSHWIPTMASEYRANPEDDNLIHRLNFACTNQHPISMSATLLMFTRRVGLFFLFFFWRSAILYLLLFS